MAGFMGREMSGQPQGAGPAGPGAFQKLLGVGGGRGMAGISGGLKGFGRGLMNKPMGKMYDAVSGGIKTGQEGYDKVANHGQFQPVMDEIDKMIEDALRNRGLGGRTSGSSSEKLGYSTRV